jgi:hypothetical protein
LHASFELDRIVSISGFAVRYSAAVNYQYTDIRQEYQLTLMNKSRVLDMSHCTDVAVQPLPYLEPRFVSTEQAMHADAPAIVGTTRTGAGSVVVLVY